MIDFLGLEYKRKAPGLLNHVISTVGKHNWKARIITECETCHLFALNTIANQRVLNDIEKGLS